MRAQLLAPALALFGRLWAALRQKHQAQLMEEMGDESVDSLWASTPR